MYHSIILGTVLFLFTFSQGAYAADPTATVEVSIVFSSATQSFDYSYKVIVHTTNTEVFEDFEVFTTDRPKKRFGGTIVNFRQAKGKTKWKGRGSGISEFRVHTVRWTSTGGKTSDPSELDFPDPEALKPGETLEGLGMTSSFLPGATMYILSPFAPPMDERKMTEKYNQTKGTNINTVFDLSDQEFDAFFGQGSYLDGTANGITLSPLFDPRGKSLTELLTYLIAQKRQSKEVGWLSGPGADGLEKSLDAKLNAAKDSVSRGQNNTARNQLNAFLNEVEAQKSKALNNNAYLLLKLNVEYILTRLPEK